MEILIKLSLSFYYNRCLLSQQNLDTNLTENEVTPRISQGWIAVNALPRSSYSSQQSSQKESV